MPELRLPEIKRDEIVRALSEIRLPDVDLSKIDWSKLDPTKIDRPKIELPDIELPRVDVRRAMENAAIRAGVKERRRSRWPLVVALLITAGLAVWALLRQPSVRAQVEETARKARARLDQLRDEREAREAAFDEDLSLDDIATPVAETDLTDDVTPVPVGPGPKGRKATSVDADAPVFEEASSLS